MKRLFCLAVFAAAPACTGTNDPTRLGEIQVSFATVAAPTAQLSRGTPGVEGASAIQNDTVVVGADTIVLTDVQVVLREIEMQRVTTPDCTGGDQCEEFETGPVLITLPLTPGAQQEFALTDVPPGTFNEIEFDIHKPDDGDPEDQAFIAANPDFARISIRVRGTFNGTPFEFTTDLNVEQELELNPALVVTAGVSTNVTIFVDLAGWFVVAGALVDPADPGVADEIEENIENSFEAFEDPDRSGSGDDD